MVVVLPVGLPTKSQGEKRRRGGTPPGYLAVLENVLSMSEIRPSPDVNDRCTPRLAATKHGARCTHYPIVHGTWGRLAGVDRDRRHLAMQPTGSSEAITHPDSHRTWRAEFLRRALRALLHNTARVCSARRGSRNFGCSGGIFSLRWLSSDPAPASRAAHKF